MSDDADNIISLAGHRRNAVRDEVTPFEDLIIEAAVEVFDRVGVGGPTLATQIARLVWERMHDTPPEPQAIDEEGFFCRLRQGVHHRQEWDDERQWSTRPLYWLERR